MNRVSAFLLVFGVLLMGVGLAGFHTSDQTYEYAPESVNSVPAGEEAYEYGELPEQDKAFVRHTGVTVEGTDFGDGTTIRFSENDDPRDFLDFYTERNALQSLDSYVRYEGRVYNLQGSSIAGFELVLWLLPKYVLVFTGLLLSIAVTARETTVEKSVLIGGFLVGGVVFGLVEWFVPDFARHLLPLLTALVVSGGLFDRATRRSD